MIRILLALLLFYLVASCLICLRRWDHKFHLFFHVHLSLFLITICICYKWFVEGTEFVFDYGAIWGYIQRGSLEALSSAMGIVGVGSILLSWTYGERDKLTLGKPQIDMVNYLFGQNYPFFLVIHVASTVLSLVTMKCAAREASLWSFITVLWGFLSQAVICLSITLNRKNREKIALALWERECQEIDKPLVIEKMAKHLAEADVRNNKEYRIMMGRILCNWISSTYDKNSADYGISVQNIKTASYIYRVIAENVPDSDRAILEEDILKAACDRVGIIEPMRESSLVLLCFGYYRYLYAGQAKERQECIHRIGYYVKNQHTELKLFAEILRECDCAIQWYSFLNQLEGVPQHGVPARHRKSYMGIAFQHLIVSFFEVPEHDAQSIAILAWDQVHLEVV